MEKPKELVKTPLICAVEIICKKKSKKSRKEEKRWKRGKRKKVALKETQVSVP